MAWRWALLVLGAACIIFSYMPRGPDDDRGADELLAPGEFDPSDAVSYYPQDREAGFILLSTAKARSNLRIRTHMQTEMRAHPKKSGLSAPYA